MALTQVQPGMLASDSQYYAYKHIRNDTKAIFYVGKGKEYRAKNKNHRNIYWKRVVEKANGFEVNYLCQNVDEELAYFCEEERIDQLKQFGIELTNLTSGGEGAGSGENHHIQQDFLTTIRLQNDSDGKGDYIAFWDHPTLARPTDEQLA